MIELIEKTGTEISEYNPVAAGLAELRRRYADVAVDVSTPKALAEAVKIRAEIRAPRYETEKIRKMLKAPALAHAKLIDSEAARITAELIAIETPWDEAIKTEEARKEVERAAREAAERQRITAIHARIADIKGAVAQALECREPAAVAALIEGLVATPMTGFDEFDQEAAEAVASTLARLNQIAEAKGAEQAERERIKAEQQAERERLALERAALAKERAEQDERDRKFALELKELRDAQEAQAQAQRAASAAERESEIQKVIREVAIEKQVVPVLFRPKRPSDIEMVRVLADHYGVRDAIVMSWMLDFNLEAALDIVELHVKEVA